MHTSEIDSVVSALTPAELEKDPYPLYRRLRDEAPVAFFPQFDAWMLSSWEDVRAAHGDPARFTSEGAFEPECIGEGNIVSIDGERHRRLRRAMQPSLHARAIGDMMADVLAQVIEERLAAIESLGEADLLASYFEPISVIALGGLMGIPEVDADTLRRWFRGLILGSSNPENDSKKADESNAIGREIDDTLRPVLERMAGEPDGSLLSHLIEHAEGATFDDRLADVMPTIKIIIAGGLQEPGHGAATVVAGLLSDESLRERFVAAPAEHIDDAVEEGLRWVAPIQINSRTTTEQVEMSGVKIPAGAIVFLSEASANRDEKRWGSEAQYFKIDRPRQQHVGFGFGTHFCPGNHFGRAMMRMSIQQLFDRFPDLQLARPVEFFGFTFRAPARLDCRWVPTESST